MKPRIPVLFAWSGGKDSAFALHRLMRDARYEVRYLLSTFNGALRRLSMHGVREELIEAQAECLGLPLLKVYVHAGDNAEYEQQMRTALLTLKREGIKTVAFGDIFLEDLRTYREKQMQAIGMDCLFPVWKADTKNLVQQFIGSGFRTITCCVNDGYLDRAWCGKLIDEQFIEDLPPAVDPCGENGEFHSFCFAGPVFKKPLSIIAGEIVYRPLEEQDADPPAGSTVRTKGFWYCDLLLT